MLRPLNNDPFSINLDTGINPPDPPTGIQVGDSFVELSSIPSFFDQDETGRYYGIFENADDARKAQEAGVVARVGAPTEAFTYKTPNLSRSERAINELARTTREAAALRSQGELSAASIARRAREKEAQDFRRRLLTSAIGPSLAQFLTGRPQNLQDQNLINQLDQLRRQATDARIQEDATRATGDINAQIAALQAEAQKQQQLANLDLQKQQAEQEVASKNFGEGQRVAQAEAGNYNAGFALGRELIGQDREDTMFDLDVTGKKLSIQGQRLVNQGRALANSQAQKELDLLSEQGGSLTGFATGVGTVDALLAEMKRGFDNYNHATGDGLFNLGIFHSNAPSEEQIRQARRGLEIAERNLTTSYQAAKRQAKGQPALLKQIDEQYQQRKILIDGLTNTQHDEKDLYDIYGENVNQFYNTYIAPAEAREEGTDPSDRPEADSTSLRPQAEKPVTERASEFFGPNLPRLR